MNAERLPDRSNVDSVGEQIPIEAPLAVGNASSGEGYSPQPIDERALADMLERQAAAAASIPRRVVYDCVTPPAEPLQFSLATMFWLVTIACVVFAIGRVLPPPLFAGVCGALSVIYPIVLGFLGALETPRARLGWWLLMAIYLTAIIVAIVNQWP